MVFPTGSIVDTDYMDCWISARLSVNKSARRRSKLKCVSVKVFILSVSDIHVHLDNVCVGT